MRMCKRQTIEPAETRRQGIDAGTNDMPATAFPAAWPDAMLPD